MLPLQDESERGAVQRMPVPTGGWNTRDPLDAMPPEDAAVLDNVFPALRGVEIRSGFTEHATGLGVPPRTLSALITSDGTSKLVAVANERIWDVTATGAATDITGTTTPTNDDWQTVMFRNRLIMVNGNDQPQQYNGTTVSDAAYTGVSDDADLFDVTSYKNRLFFLEKQTGSVWYGAVDTITGALTEFPLLSLLKRGGELSFIASWSRGTGAGREDFLVVCSEQGEVLVYSGDPSAGFEKAAHVFIPKPLNDRSYIPFGTDLIVLTRQGAIPLSSTFGEGIDPGQYQYITDKINEAFRSAVTDFNVTVGWEGIVYPDANWLLINVPISQNSTIHQYVMNTQTGAWCRFTGMNGNVWEQLGNNIYFGGVDGTIYMADSGFNDNGVGIEARIKTAFSFLGEPHVEKLFTGVKPTIISDSDLDFFIDVDTDFQDRLIESTVSVTGSTGSDWDVAEWDVAEWGGSSLYKDDWYGVDGVGSSVAIRLEGSFTNVYWMLTSLKVLYQRGGLL